MTPQEHADHLLRVWQQRRELGLKPSERLPQDNKSEEDWWIDLEVIRKCIERRS